MKKRYYALFAAILVVAAGVLGFGVYLKGHIYDPYGIYQKESIFSLPFVLLADGKLGDAFRGHEDVTVPADSTAESGTQGTETEADSTSEPKPIASQPVTESQTSTTESTSVPPITTTVPEASTTEPPATTTAPEPTQTEKPTTPPATTEAPDGNSSYFDDALFIGDSRLCGLRDYARLGDADYFCDVGMTVFSVVHERASDQDFSSVTLEELLASKKYGKVYITLGINECGYATESFMNAYRNLISMVQSAQPNAIVILQSIMVVTEGYAQNGSYFSPEHIGMLNENIAGLSDSSRIFYIDVNEVMADENGYLKSDLTGDGCHLYASENQTWANWLCRYQF